MTNKLIKVKITGNAKETYTNLIKLTQEEKQKGITSSKQQTLLNSIQQKIDLLKQHPEQGIHIAKNKIPKKYVTLYDVNNLWKLNLSQAWRMIYTIKGSEVEILSLIIDIYDHKKYEKTFGYKNK